MSLGDGVIGPFFRKKTEIHALIDHETASNLKE
jgi:hypothetical protein